MLEVSCFLYLFLPRILPVRLLEPSLPCCTHATLMHSSHRNPYLWVPSNNSTGLLPTWYPCLDKGFLLPCCSTVGFASKCTPSLGQTQMLSPAAGTRYVSCDPAPAASAEPLTCLTHLRPLTGGLGSHTTPVSGAGGWRPLPALGADAKTSPVPEAATTGQGAHTPHLTPLAGTKTLFTLGVNLVKILSWLL